MKRLKTITSYTGLSRFFAECEQGSEDCAAIFGYVPSHLMPATNRYASGPCWAVHRHNGRDVLSIEVRHKTYEIWQIDGSSICDTEERASEQYLRHCRRSA